MRKEQPDPKRSQLDSNTDEPKVTIDHEAYPWIVDSILQSAPWSVLCAFRQTSKAFCARCDDLQSGHLVLSASRLSEMTVTSPYGRIPSIQERRYVQWTRPVKKRSIAALQRSQHVLGKIRIVDIVGVGDKCLEPITAALTNVKTLRLRPDNHGRILTKSPVKADHLVVWCQFGYPIKRYWETAGPTLATNRHVVARSVKKLVINVNYHAAQLRGPFPVSLQHSESGDPSDLQELVFVFTDWQPIFKNNLGKIIPFKVPALDVHPNWTLSRELANERWSRLCECLGSLILGSTRQLKTTVVDLNTIDPAWMGMAPVYGNMLQRQLVPETIDMISSVLQAQGRESELDGAVAAMRAIEFVTREEYASRMSREEFELDTKKEIGIPVP